MNHKGLIAGVTLLGLALLTDLASAQSVMASDPASVASQGKDIVAQASEGGPGSAMQLVMMLTIASLAPAIILTTTCFARFAIVFSFVRNGLATQGAPPSQVLVGMALFMTLFVMAPTGTLIYDAAVQPYMAGEIDEIEAFKRGTPPLREFLLKRTSERDLALFYEVSSQPRPTSADDVPLRIAVPAFVLSELQTAFKMGLVILLPFLVIDLIVASILSALGMVMLPPPIVSLPIKLLVFVSVDGWHLVVKSLLLGVA
ncbi:MAG: flagellar type III secretion system pore protein FliP [Kofleriaceae bacterium]|nr:flagellar type III secretion system pore protein FliP [Kofleriaceae bacterium]